MKDVWSLVLTLWLAAQAVLQAATPDLKDVAYDDEDEAQRLDVYLAKSEKPAPVMVYIHGGAWRAGSKNPIPAFLAEAHAEGWLAVVSEEYRFTDVAPHPQEALDEITKKGATHFGLFNVDMPSLNRSKPSRVNY